MHLSSTLYTGYLFEVLWIDSSSKKRLWKSQGSKCEDNNHTGCAYFFLCCVISRLVASSNRYTGRGKGLECIGTWLQENFWYPTVIVASTKMRIIGWLSPCLIAAASVVGSSTVVSALEFLRREQRVLLKSPGQELEGARLLRRTGMFCWKRSKKNLVSSVPTLPWACLLLTSTATTKRPIYKRCLVQSPPTPTFCRPPRHRGERTHGCSRVTPSTCAPTRPFCKDTSWSPPTTRPMERIGLIPVPGSARMDPQSAHGEESHATMVALW